MATNQNEEFVQLLYAWWRATQQKCIQEFCQNTCSAIAIKTYFHFSHYKSVETLSCHSNKNTWETAIKNNNFVEANVMNISAKFQLHPHLKMASEMIFWKCFILCWGLTSQSTIFQSRRDGATASWVINQYFRGVKCLAQGHNTAAVGFEPPTSRSGVRHSTTEPPCSPENVFVNLFLWLLWQPIKFSSLDKIHVW